MPTNYTEILNIAKSGQWNQAHQLIQSDSDVLACLIHGYLHRVEGDQANAQYWYGRANQILPDNTLKEEWSRLYTLINSE